VTLPQALYPDDARVSAFHARMLEAIEGLEPVESAALIRNEPASNVPSPVVTFERADTPMAALNDRPRADMQVVSPSTFDVLRMAIVAGRGFLPNDTVDAARVAVVSRLSAERFWADRSPIGTSIRLGADSTSIRIVGVVADVELNWYDGDARPTIYVPDAQAPSRTTSVVVRTRVDPLAVAGEVRAAVARLDAAQSIGGLEPLATSIADSLSPIRVVNHLLVTGATVACFLAAIGVFGVLAQSVAQRLGEFGVRFALGATPRSIASMVVRDALVTGAIGLAGGMVFASAIIRLAGSALVGLFALDGSAVAAVVVCTITLVVAAALAPAMRAARVDVGALLRS
jgi:hypothetical protein